jgi:hypothetical protein
MQIKREKRLLLSPRRRIATVHHRLKTFSRLSIVAPIAAAAALSKRLFDNEKYGRAGAHIEHRPHIAAAAIACFLRNTFPKTSSAACDSACSSLHVGTRWLM